MRYLLLAAILALLSITGTAFASGGAGEYELDWPINAEILAYHSCGCADSCWVAEVRTKKTNKLKARLRCDCEKLHFSKPGVSQERTLPGTCEAINQSGDKPALIADKMLVLSRAKNGMAVKR